ncbi:MAG: 16S rRNA (cytosine(1402)-N(4))-methyltransferase RsmH [Defluviitaleaceae bacterium]|nr:16S rRNA (cytosine(1402)-N(4))-methyltransferase RsmH [Defluviitaleaceae bacterium]MCL2836653.1 16S rRNA (cytosine(1402)-N(4))-methyltransferase RsmH [Defluviitaleaceae bacterium]
MDTSGFRHVSVLADESVDGLAVKPGGIYLDGTCGGGGHSALIAERLNGKGRLICVDRDNDAVSAAGKRLKKFGNITFARDNFSNVNIILDKLGIKLLDGVLLDLGVSSWQLDEPSRGFSFLHPARLDMRMDREAGKDAREIVNTYDEERLKRIFTDFGEERYAGRVARAIVRERAVKPVETTSELAAIVSGAIPRASWEQNKHPATRVFQAIRIEVNNELDGLGQALRDISARLNAGGRFCVITFHSLEDRIVKNTFKSLADPCECPRSLPYCVCGKEASVKAVTKKPIIPSDEEIAENPRARSAKLRIVQKI